MLILVLILMLVLILILILILILLVLLSILPIIRCFVSTPSISEDQLVPLGVAVF